MEKELESITCIQNILKKVDIVCSHIAHGTREWEILVGLADVIELLDMNSRRELKTILEGVNLMIEEIAESVEDGDFNEMNEQIFALSKLETELKELMNQSFGARINLENRASILEQLEALIGSKVDGVTLTLDHKDGTGLLGTMKKAGLNSQDFFKDLKLQEQDMEKSVPEFLLHLCHILEKKIEECSGFVSRVERLVNKFNKNGITCTIGSDNSVTILQNGAKLHVFDPTTTEVQQLIIDNNSKTDIPFAEDLDLYLFLSKITGLSKTSKVPEDMVQ